MKNYVYVLYSLEAPYLPIYLVESITELSDYLHISYEYAKKIVQRGRSCVYEFTIEKVVL